MRIGDYLKHLQWSQTDLAKHAGISVGTVKRAMSGETISARSAQAITSALDDAMSKTSQVRPGDIKGMHVSRATRKKVRSQRAKPEIQA